MHAAENHRKATLHGRLVYKLYPLLEMEIQPRYRSANSKAAAGLKAGDEKQKQRGDCWRRLMEPVLLQKNDTSICEYWSFTIHNSPLVAFEIVYQSLPIF